MMNLKLKTIASLIEKKDIVLDTCCDHAYLAMYLKEKQLCQKVYASDINDIVLKNAKKNIDQAGLNLPLYLSDGFKDIPTSDIDTAVIAGVGTNTVLHILDAVPKNIKKLIISSNNQHEILRKELYRRGFYIQKEIVIVERNKYYVIMLVTKDYVKENRYTLTYGKSNNKEYFLYLLKKEQEVLQKIPHNKIFLRLLHHKKIKDLQSFIKRISDYS